MKRTGLFFILALFELFFSRVFGLERKPNLANITWASAYLADGFKIGGNSPVMEVSLRHQLLVPEFSIMYWSALKVDRKQDTDDEHNLFIFYNRDYFKEEKYAFNFHSYYDYWFYPNTPITKDKFGDTISSEIRQGSKLHLGISMVNLLPFAGSFIIPSYNIYYWAYWAQNRRDKFQGGTHHEALVSYQHWVPKFFPGAKNQYCEILASLNYNDGAFGVVPGLSHSTATLATGLQALNATFVISLNQQWSYQRSVNPTNDFWTTLSFLKEL